uniref:Zinc finger protein 540-like n=1 Tax=Saccoglossus kowalevskii TaxID=10224 RepID=A0ABM0M782_SACKO|nr:PREDICTED: zinc finger protein 540-like [Saccoglossus kowalevskii]
MATNNQEHQSITSLTCKLCNNEFGTKYELNKHMAGHIVRWQISRLGTTQDKSYSMDYTQPDESKSTQSDKRKIIRADEHNDTQPVGLDSAEYKQPLNESQKEVLPQCEVCQRFFKTKHALNIHMHTAHKYKSNMVTNNKDISVLNTSGTNLPPEEPVIKKMVVKKTEGSEQKCQAQFENCWLSYECKICESTFPSKEYFDFHMLKHTGGLSRCSQCVRVFTSKDALDHHITSSHRVHFFRCLKCNELTLICSMLQHINQHRVELCTGKQQPVVAECAGMQQPVIGVCPETQKPVINTRCASFHDVCTLCDVQFYSQSRAEEHFMIYHNPKKEPFPKCRICNKMFYDVVSLNYHLTSGMGLNCKHCSRYFCSDIGFKAHLMSCPKAQVNCIEFGDGKLSVDTTLQGMKADTTSHVKKSNKKHGKFNSSIRKCSLCKCKFKSSIALKYHALSCKSVIDTKCQYCNRHLKSNVALTHHIKLCKIRIGTVECKHCRCLFKPSQIMRQHVNNCKRKVALSSYIKRCKTRNRCKSCNNGFMSGFLLKSHVISCNATMIAQSVKRASHKRKRASKKSDPACTNKRPVVAVYICVNCQCSFTSKFLLDSHVESCSVAYRCECRYKLESVNSLQEHMKCHVDIEFADFEIYKCRFCFESFSTTVAVRDHLVRKHSVKMPISIKGSSWRPESKHIVEQNPDMPLQKRSVAQMQKPCLHMCGKCGDTFSEKVYLEIHMDAHKTEYYWIPEFTGLYADVYRERFESHKWKIQNRTEDIINVDPYKNLKIICDDNNTSSAVGIFRLKFV